MRRWGRLPEMMMMTTMTTTMMMAITIMGAQECDMNEKVRTIAWNDHDDYDNYDDADDCDNDDGNYVDDNGSTRVRHEREGGEDRLRRPTSNNDTKIHYCDHMIILKGD